jgi:Rha family phage regulatory protein
MYNLTLIRQNGGVYIDSREVAELIEKPHNDLMKAIRKYCDYLNEGNFSLVDFFVNSTYLDGKGEERPCYLLSKMGCEVCANKLSGKKGVLFTAAYVTKFNRMEAAERAELEAQIKNPVPRLGEYNACARIVVPALRNLGATSERIVGFLQGVYEPLGIAVATEDELAGVPQTYTAKQIAKIYGVYSHNGNPHSQAVSCILNENIFVTEEHKTVLTSDYGTHIGVSVRYDEHALQSVGEWLSDNGYPGEIYGFERTFYVLYDSEPLNN